MVEEWQRWLPGVGLFIALQVGAFFLNILSNSATPVAERIGMVLRTRWKDQRRQAAVERIALVISSQNSPAIESTRILIAVLGVVLSMFGVMFVRVARLYSDVHHKTWIMSWISDSTGKETVDLVIGSVFMLFAVVFMLFISARTNALFVPKRTIHRSLKQLEKHGFSPAAALADANALVGKRSFRLPVVSSETSLDSGA